jgi:hypothetical protein
MAKINPKFISKIEANIRSFLYTVDGCPLIKYRAKKMVNGKWFDRSFLTVDEARAFLDILKSQKVKRLGVSTNPKSRRKYIEMAAPGVERTEYFVGGMWETRYQARRMVSRKMYSKLFKNLDEAVSWVASFGERQKPSVTNVHCLELKEAIIIQEEDELMYVKSGLKFFLSSGKNKEGLCCINVNGDIQQVRWDNLLLMVKTGKIIKI